MVPPLRRLSPVHVSSPVLSILVSLCSRFAVCLVYLNSHSKRVLQLCSPPSSEFDSPLAFSPPIPGLTLYCHYWASAPPPPPHAHTTLSHSTTQPFATLLLSTVARLVSRIQIKSINQMHRNDTYRQSQTFRIFLLGVVVPSRHDCSEEISPVLLCRQGDIGGEAAEKGKISHRTTTSIFDPFSFTECHIFAFGALPTCSHFGWCFGG